MTGPDWDRIYRILGQYEPYGHDVFREALAELDFRNPAWLYETAIGDSSPWQGDICLQDVELSYIDEDGNTRVLEGPAMLLSHGCDAVVGQSDMVTLAPIFEVDAFAARIEDPEKRESQCGALRGNLTTGLFYLPAVADRLAESYVDFSYAAAVMTSRVDALFNGLGPDERLRLTAKGWWLFGGKLAHHFARAEDKADYTRVA